MEENKRFRNHISIVFEKMGSMFFIMVSLFVWEIIGDLDELTEDFSDIGSSGGEWKIALIIIGAVAALLALIIVWQLIVWSKTYISIRENTIVIEKNTLMKKKNTIGIKNISNVNIEQNLFEMLMGTCKIKLDTNSMSTADTTDVKIVLKKKDAEIFRQRIMNILQEKDEENYRADVLEEDIGEGLAGRTDLGDIMLHGLFSINLFSVLVIIGCITGVVEVAADLSGQGLAGKSLLGMLSSILIIVVICFSAIWDILKGFIRFFEFRARRRGDKLYLSYGLLKKVNYAIPVDKINAVKLIQSPQARLAGMYMAELINVGLGDDEGEEKAFFLLYGKKQKIRGEIERLLPEFSGCLDKKIVRQPVCVWTVWIFRMAVFGGVMGLLLGIGAEFFESYLRWIMAAVGGLTILALLLVIGGYKTRGSLVDENFLVLVDGCLGREFVFVKYDKIQYIEMEQNFIARHFQVQKGDIYLLASTVNRSQTMPYFYEKEMEKIKEYLLQ